MNWTEEELEEYQNKKKGKKTKPKKKPKYNNNKTVIDDIKFDSKNESLYYLQLKQCKEDGFIKDFELQPKYELIPKFKYMNKNVRAMTYSPDFKVYRLDETYYLVDIKSIGSSTQQGELRRKLFQYYNPDKELIWVCRNLKHGDARGWILYEDLKKIYRDEKKVK